MRQARVHILDVGQGDTTIVELPVGAKKRVFGVIDCIKFDEVTLPYLQELEVEELAFVCGTHPHADHIEDIQKLLETYEGKVGEYWDSGYEPEYQPVYQERLIQYLEHNHIKKVIVRSGTRFLFGKTILHVLNPPANLPHGSQHREINENNASIVISVQHGLSRILLSGDANFASWAQIWVTHRDVMKSQVVKLSHHGSMHGNFLECLEVIDPRYVIISVGADNPYNMPHKSTIDILNQLYNVWKKIDWKNRVFTTRDHGHILVTSNGSRRLKITTKK